MADLSNFRVGQTIQLSDGRVCVIRFLGTAHFSAGDWIGVELDDGTGKNDGSVQGERYFECEPGNGMFLRPAGVTQILEEAPKPPPKTIANGNGTAKVRPSSGLVPATRRTSVVDAATRKRASVNLLSPTPSGRPASTTKKPVRPLSQSPTKPSDPPPTTRPIAGTARRTSAVAGKPITSRGPRLSMGPPALPSASGGRLNSQTASTPRLTGSTTSRPAGSRTSLRAGQGLGLKGLTVSKPSSVQASESSGVDSQDETRSSGSRSPPKVKLLHQSKSKTLSPVLPRASATNGAAVGGGNPGRDSATVTTAGPQRLGSSTALNREIEDLKTKLRIMEKRRMEDRDKLKGMEKLQSERDKFEGIVHKLQLKYQPQQQEMNDLRKNLKEAQERTESIESSHAEFETTLEMATLDREMAEEQAEAFKTELEALKFKTEELELEVEVLREENDELGKEMSPEEKASQGWLQMERNNERLREALLRLRDITKQQQDELKDQIKSLEDDVKEMTTVKQQYEETREKLLQSEANAEDTRQQLEAALGAEEMIEELTEKNMNISEQMEELRVAVEDLESLKELNDELEINHIETEKQMQEEIDYKDSIISDHGRKVLQQEETMIDYEHTVSRFRELVTNLQGDLEQMRTSQLMTENEAEELSSRSRAMMDLNMKLQVSAAKTQVKSIDLELRRLEAQEASEHLAIVQLFLPDTFHNERDSVLALLRFKRVGFKSNLLYGFVKDRVGGGSLSTGHEDDIFAACDVMDKLTWVGAMCDRFIAALGSCTVEQFSKFEGALYELEPVERALNGWIENLKRDELREKACAEELSRTMSLLTHLAEIHVPQDSLEAHAEETHMRALLTQSHLESSASALFHMKSMIQSRLSPTLRSIPEDEESTPTPDHNEEVHVFAMKTETVISHVRSAKVVIGKVVRGLDELKARSLALESDHLPAFSSAQESAFNLATYIRNLGLALWTLLNEEGRETPVTFSEIDSTLSRVQLSSTSGTMIDGEPFQVLTSALRTLSTTLLDLGALTSDLTMFCEFSRPAPPWLALSKEQKSTTSATETIEAALTKAQSALAARTTDLALRNQALDEASVKIELLESRTRDFAAKTNRISVLEDEVEASKRQQQDTAGSLESSDNQLRALEAERDQLKIELENRRLVANTSDAEAVRKDALRSKASEAEVTTLKADLKAAQGAIAHLRRVTASAAFSSPAQQIPHWLSTPLTKPQLPVAEAAATASASLLRQEASDSLTSLLTLASTARPVKLHPRVQSADWRGWRPVKESTKFVVAQQTEDWERWREWAVDVASRWSYHKQLAKPREARDRPADPIAMLRLNTTAPEKNSTKHGMGMPVRIVRPEDWDEIEGASRG
ncbi:MAG: hypothetical protein M1814_005245 [Vezdaea aestivalis]|nr:MAG: hypothetical protein M1814_005245 [Vezdaea aestivalis]